MAVNLTKMRIELLRYYSAATGRRVIQAPSLALLLQMGIPEVMCLGPMLASSLAGEWRGDTLVLQEVPGSASRAKELKEAAKGKQEAGDVREVFDYWVQKTGRTGGAKLTADRATKIRARFSEGYTVEQCKRAIDGCMASPFHCGQNDHGRVYTDITLIFRGGSKLEEFAAMAPGHSGYQGKPSKHHEQALDSKIEQAVYADKGFEVVVVAVGGDENAISRWADQIAHKFSLSRHEVVEALRRGGGV